MATRTEVPQETLDPSVWMLVSARPWAYTENIMILEARTLLFPVRHACEQSPPSRLLFLVDNVGLVLAAKKGRFKSFVLLVELRWMFACAIHWLTFRWIPSEVNFAYERSRFVDPHYDPSKCLLCHVDARVTKCVIQEKPVKGEEESPWSSVDVLSRRLLVQGLFREPPRLERGKPETVTSASESSCLLSRKLFKVTRRALRHEKSSKCCRHWKHLCQWPRSATKPFVNIPKSGLERAFAFARTVTPSKPLEVLVDGLLKNVSFRDMNVEADDTSSDSDVERDSQHHRTQSKRRA